MARAGKKKNSTRRKKAAAPARKAAAKPAAKKRATKAAPANPTPRKRKVSRPRKERASVIGFPAFILVAPPLNDGDAGLRKVVPFAQHNTFGSLIASGRTLDVIMDKKLYRTNGENILLDLDDNTIEIGIDFVEDVSSDQ